MGFWSEMPTFGDMGADEYGRGAAVMDAAGLGNACGTLLSRTGISLVTEDGPAWLLRRGERGVVVMDLRTLWPLCDEGDTTDWDDPAVAWYPDAEEAARAVVGFHEALTEAREDVGA